MKHNLMGLLLIGLILFGNPDAWGACPDPAPTDAICVEWQAPTENVDGTTIPDTGPGSIASYRLFWSTTAGAFNVGDSVLIDDPTLREFTATGAITITRPAGGGDVDLFIVMTATNTETQESAYSNTVGKVLTFPPWVPQTPTILDVTVPLIISS